MLLAHFPSFYFIPETRNMRPPRKPFGLEGPRAGVMSPQGTRMCVQDTDESEQHTSSQKPEAAEMREIWKRLRSMLRHTGLRVIFLAFVVKRVAFASEQFIYQYASEKMKLRLAKTVPARLAQLSGAILITSTIMPLISLIWPRGPGHVFQKDLAIMRASLAIGVFSFVWMWKSKTFLLLCLGGLRYSWPASVFDC